MKEYLLIRAIVALAFRPEAQTVNEWENTEINSINKEQPHAYGFLAGEKANNPTVRSLNGIWKFKWSPDPQSRPVNFYTENYPDETWDNRKVFVLKELNMLLRKYQSLNKRINDEQDFADYNRCTAEFFKL